LSKINPTLRTAKLPSELLTQKDRVIKVRIGKPISVAEQDEYKTLEEYTEFLRKKTYMLANSFKKESSTLLEEINANLKSHKNPKQIAKPANHNKILEEIAMLKDSDDRLLHSKNYYVFLVTADKIPNILHEIGRLREITFRAVGEGTNESIDLDKYDQYYHHMFLWDDEAQEIAGHKLKLFREEEVNLESAFMALTKGLGQRV
jgi:hypothetical protein